MPQNKKKTKTPVKKNAKSSAKKNTKSTVKKKARSIAKKITKSPAKKKAIAVSRKKAKSPVRKKVISEVIKKTTRAVSKKAVNSNKKIKSVPIEVPVPEVIKPDEGAHPIPGFNEMHPQTIEENKKLERQLHHSEDVSMNRENQKVKSAMAKRQSMKTIFRTPRGS